MKHLTKAVFTAILSVIALTMLCVGLAGCTPVTDNSGDDTTATTYYMSSASKEWATYDDAKAVPSDVLFVENDGVYTLSVELVADEQISFHKIGEEGALAVELFSEGDQLVAAEDNRLTAMRSGSYTLTLTEGDTLTLTYEYEAAVESVSIITAIDTMRVDDVIVFEAEVVYADGNVGSDAVWTSSDDAIISITPAGEATAIAVGTATLTATAGAQSADIEVAVVEGEIVATSIVLDKQAVTMEKGDVITLTATVLPENATDKEVVWKSDDNTLVNVKEDGTVTASQTKSGTTNVTVTLMSNASISATCAVTVREPVTAISAVESLSVVAGSPRQLTINFTPSTATNKDVEVEVTSGSEYLDATAEGGVVTLNGKAQGVAELVVTSVDNNDATAIVEVKVLAEGQIAVELDCTDFEIGWNSSKYITANIIGDIENPTYTWTPSSAAITMDDPTPTTPNRVLIHANVVGHATVTCTVNGQYSASVVVTVGNTGNFYVSTNYDPSDNKAGNIFTETETEGIYELERYFNEGDDIRILFANMNSSTWTGQIHGIYYNYSEPCDYIETKAGKETNVYVQANGIYHVELDTTGETPVFTVTVVKLDVTAVNVALMAQASSKLECGDDPEKVKETDLVANLTPTDVEFDAENMKWTVSGDGAAYVELDVTGLTCKVLLLKDKEAEIEENTSVTVTFTAKNDNGTSVSGYISISIISLAKQVDATSVTFAEKSYSYDIATNESFNATHTITGIIASVDAESTTQQINYSSSDAGVTFSPASANSGAAISVTVSNLGTFTIKATAADDSAVSATVTILVYASEMRLAGSYDNWKENDDSYKLTRVTANDNTKWQYKDMEFANGNKFRIYLGYSNRDKTGNGYWNNQIFGGQYLVSSTYASNVGSADNYNIAITKSGKYDITVDFSAATPKITVTLTQEIVQKDSYTATIKLYGAGSNWTGTALTSTKVTYDGTTDNLEVTMTYTFADQISWPNLEFSVKKGTAAEIYYDGNYAGTITFSGKFSSTKRTNYWCSTNGGVFWYEGTIASGTKVTFTLTLDSEGVLTAINIA